MKNIPKKQFAGWMLMLLLCISISAFAQSPKKVTGRVMDAQGELLIGVNVTEAADPSNGVVTDINGTFQCRCECDSHYLVPRQCGRIPANS